MQVCVSLWLIIFSGIFFATDTHGHTQTIISADMAEIMVWASGKYYIFENRTLFQNKGVIFSLTNSYISQSDESFFYSAESAE